MSQPHVTIALGLCQHKMHIFIRGKYILAVVNVGRLYNLLWEIMNIKKEKKGFALIGLPVVSKRASSPEHIRQAQCKLRRRAFTLIELLVVASIIAALASVGIIGYSSAKSKSRDAKRISDVKAIAAAVNLYGEKHENYKINNVGYSSNGWGYFNCTSGLASAWAYCGSYGSTSIGGALVSEGFLSFEPVDPSGDITVSGTATPKAGHPYMFYPYDTALCDCDAATTVPSCEITTFYNNFYVYAKLENSSGTQSAINVSPNGYCLPAGTTGAKTIYGMNYAVN